METHPRLTSVFASLLLLAGLCSAPLRAQEASTRTYALRDGSRLVYQEPGFWRTMGSMPSDMGTFVKDSFTKDSLPWLGAITASTLILIHYDQAIYDGARKTGRKLSISSKDKTRTYVTVGGVALFRGPSDLGSALYFIGDGWVTIGAFGYLKIYNLFKHDWRASQTANQLGEGLIATGFVTELMKNIAGRETPERESGKGGVWRMFPGLGEYIKHRPSYDAFPSGHLASYTMTMTILADNYPDNRYIKPIGYTLMAGLCFQMMNNGVHWAGDYPLGFAVGYGIGKAISSHGRTAARRVPGTQEKQALSFAPYLSPYGGVGAQLAYRF